MISRAQYEHKLLPPRLEMEKLEDDMLKQVGWPGAQLFDAIDVLSCEKAGAA